MLLRIYAGYCMSSIEKVQRSAIFRERLVARRNWMDWTQADLAEHGHFALRSVAAWETGESDPELGNLLRLAEVLETSVGWLLGEVPADGGAILNDAHLRPVWPLLEEPTLRAVIADLSQHHSQEDTAALMHLERVVGELRARARAPKMTPAEIGGVSSRRSAAAAKASMSDAEAVANQLRESSQKHGVGAPNVRKRGRDSGAGKET